MSSLIARAREMSQVFGSMFGGRRNIFDVFGWKKEPEHKDFVAKYRKQGLAKRIINLPVNALWSDPPALEADDTFMTAWNDLLASIPVFYNIQRLDKLAGLGKYAIMVVGFDDGKDMTAPVVTAERRKVLYLQPYSEGSVTIKTYELNKTSPRYGLPLVYTVDPGRITEDRTIGTMLSRASIKSFDVHYSRVLHVAEGTLESPVFGSSRLEGSFNTLDDVWKVTGGAAETYWLAGNRGMHVDVDKDMTLEKDDAKNLSDELEEYQHELRRIIRTQGVNVKELGSKVADPTGVFDTQMSILAADHGIPKRVLMGSEAGQLASQQDRANWAQTCEERIREYGEPIVLLPFIRLLIAAGVLPQPKNLTIKWPDSFKMNPLERAQTSAQMARSATNLANMLKTIRDINSANAADAQPRIVTTPNNFTSNAGVPPVKDTSTTPPPTKELPALLPKQPMVELLSTDECRAIIGFGKHPPIFDNKKDTKPSVGKEE